MSRKIIPSVEQLYQEKVLVYGGDEVENGLYLFLISGYLTLIKSDGKDIEIVCTYTGYTTPQYYYDVNTGYIWGITYSSDTYYNITRFKIENQKILLKDRMTSVNVGSPSALAGVYAENDTFVMFYGAPTLNFRCYTVLENGSLSDASIAKELTYASGIRGLNNYGARFYVSVSYKDTSISTSRKCVGISLIEVSKEAATVKAIYSTKWDYSNVTFATTRVIEKNGKAFFAYFDEDTDKNVGICIYDMETGSLTKHKISAISVSMSYKYLEISDFVTEDIFLVKVNTQFFMLKYSWKTGIVEKYGNVIELDNEARPLETYSLICNQNSVVRFGQYAMFFRIEGNTLYMGEDRKIIQPYDESIGSIGLAKNSGKAGEVIEVYIPRK